MHENVKPIQIICVSSYLFSCAVVLAFAHFSPKMTKTMPMLVLITFASSGLALIFSVVALGTDRWFVAKVDLSTALGTTSDNSVNYGLFSGSYSRLVSTQSSYSLFITCDFGQNKCAMLCGEFDLRMDSFQLLLQNDQDTDGYRYCTPTPMSASNSVRFPNSSRADDDSIPEGFLNCGVWLSAVLFLAVSCLFGILSTVLAILNTVSNPVETFLSIIGLFACNCVAFTGSLVTLLLWGIHFIMVLSDNAAIFDTIQAIGTSEGAGGLGYSYWYVSLGSTPCLCLGLFILVIMKALKDTSSAK